MMVGQAIEGKLVPGQLLRRIIVLKSVIQVNRKHCKSTWYRGEIYST